MGEEKKNKLYPQVLSLFPAGRTALELMYGLLLDFRGPGRNNHLDFSFLSSGSRINRLISDTRSLPAK